MFFSKPQITIHGFKDDEILEINADNLYEASKILGHAMCKQSLDVLNRDLKSDKKYEVQKCASELSLLHNLSENNFLKIGKVNYAKRYLESLHGFADGAGISILNAAFLQKETETGCQTIIAKNKNDEIAFLHTEENDKDDNTLPVYNYRLVRIILPEKEILFFAYPGLCGWGPAFGIDKTHDFVQFVDDLIIDEKYSGPIWSNAITSMIFDTGDIKVAGKLLERIKKLCRKYSFFGGYAIHIIQNQRILKRLSLEFGGKYLEVIPDFNDFFVQVNYAKTPKLKEIAEFRKPDNLKKWISYQKMTYLEMTRREERLLSICRMGWWNTSNPTKTIDSGLKVLAYPYGDLRKYKDKDGKTKYYHTGLPSKWTFAHLIGFMGKENRFYIGKNTPPKIPGLEYSNNIDENYRYREEKLWEKD